jgi:hypothetical protein
LAAAYLLIVHLFDPPDPLTLRTPGGSCHWFDGVQQLIFENNTCDGASLTSEGSNLDTYGCPMQQHAYMHANKVTNTWGYDREVMTFDGDDRHGQNVGGGGPGSRGRVCH